jgi:hypothetical protein
MKYCPGGFSFVGSMKTDKRKKGDFVMVSAAVARVFKRDIDSNISSQSRHSHLTLQQQQSIFERVLSARHTARACGPLNNDTLTDFGGH